MVEDGKFHNRNFEIKKERENFELEAFELGKGKLPRVSTNVQGTKTFVWDRERESPLFVCIYLLSVKTFLYKGLIADIYVIDL